MCLSSPLIARSHTHTGCSFNIVFFSEFLKLFRTLFSLSVSVCTHTRQVEHQRCCRTDRVQKNYNNLRKNTIFNEHPVSFFLSFSLFFTPTSSTTSTYPHNFSLSIKLFFSQTIYSLYFLSYYFGYCTTLLAAHTFSFFLGCFFFFLPS